MKTYYPYKARTSDYNLKVDVESLQQDDLSLQVVLIYYIPS